MRRRVVGASALTLGLVLGATVSAGAATERVDQGSFTFPIDEVDTGLCGFPINVQSQATIRFTLFSDSQGTARRLLLHFSISDGTFSANGVSLRQGSNHNATEVLFDSAGNAVTVTIVGLTTQVFLPGGAIIEAGRLIEDGLTGSVVFEAGNRITHEDQQTLCGALSG
jgi:hypothetical protein